MAERGSQVAIDDNGQDLMFRLGTDPSPWGHDCTEDVWLLPTEAWLFLLAESPEACVSDVWILSFFLRDGIPPYRMGSKKQLQREMHRSVKANGQVSLPHFPVSLDGTGSAVSSGPDS